MVVGAPVQEKRVRQKKRLARVMTLVRRVRGPAVPITYRRNRVVLFSDSRQFFQTLFAALRAAETFILLEYYLIRNDRTGRQLAEELVSAVQRGVRVMLIYDYIGCVDTPSSYFKFLSQKGVELVPFNVPSFKRGIGWFDRRDHKKMTIIDGSLAFLGGCNIGDEYAGLKEQPDRFRDVGFSLAGSAVQELVQSFAETWQMERGTLPELPPLEAAGEGRRRGQARVSIVSGGPHHRASYIRSAFLLNIATASDEILVATPYFVPGPRIMRALVRAVRRGVRVRLLLPARSDVPLVRLLGRSFYGALLANGVEIYELEHEILHAKVMLIDRERTVLGSANLDQRSFHRNFEINAVIDNRTFGCQIRMLFEEQFELSSRILLEVHERRGVIARAVERVANLFSWFL